MKKFLLILLLSTTALAQINSDQIKKKTDGGLTGDAVKAVTVTIPRAASAPASPLTGQLWCDTNYDPCVLKIYDGSAWDAAPTNTTIPTQAAISSLPGSPVDGQVFYAKSNRNFYVYDATAGAWYGLQTVLWASGTDVTDVPSGTVITAPSGAPTVTKNTACGSGETTGTYSYKYTYVNSTGGETTPSPVSNTITYAAANDCTGWTGITAGGSGTITRRLYQSKVNAPGGPWYWTGSVADNSTTTATTTTVNAATVLYAPEVNFSGAMPANWTVANDSPATTSGGCGTTATQTFRCKSSNTGTNNSVNLTSDVIVRANRTLAAYVGGNFTVTARFLEAGSQEPPTYSGCSYTSGLYPLGTFGVRYGTAANAPKYIIGPLNNTFNTACLSTTGTGFPWGYIYRATVAGAESVGALGANGWPMTTWVKTSLPVWARWVKRGTNLNFFHSVDGAVWSDTQNCTGVTYSDAGCSFDISGSPSSWNQWESAVHMMNTTSAQAYNNFVIEWDSFSIRVDP